jgi:hypothetical protein
VGRGGEKASPDDSASMEGKRVSKLSSPSGMEDEGSSVLLAVGAGEIPFDASKEVGKLYDDEVARPDLGCDADMLVDRIPRREGSRPELGL